MTARDAQALDETVDGSQPSAGGDASVAELAQGRIIAGRYEIVRKLGAGAMGAVYEARHRTVERRVAVKVLHAGVDHDATTLQRFMAEARTAGRARHRNIVEVIDFGVEGTTHWMVLEYLDGETLEACIEREAPMEPARVLALLDPILRALTHAHGLGFIHRDLKPGNLFLAREEGVEGVVPKVLDFGIAKNTASSARLTATETIVGTPAYMAPEQIESSRDVMPAADQYAMGCVVFEMLTGRIPVGGETLHGLLVNKVTREPEALQAARPELPEALCACVMRALARDPAQRYDSVEAFRVALSASLSTAPAPVVSAPLVPTPAAPAPLAPPPAPALPAPHVAAVPPPSNLRRVGLAGLVLVVVATLVAGARRVSRDVAPASPRPTPVALSSAVVPRPGALVDAEPVGAVDAAAQSGEDAFAASEDVHEVDAGDDAHTSLHRHHGRRHDGAQGHRLSVDPNNPL